MPKGPLQSAWKRFVDGVRKVLAGAPDERILDPYMAVRNTALDVVEREEFAQALQDSYDRLTEISEKNEGLTAPQRQEICNLLLDEVKAFPEAVELALAPTEPSAVSANKKRVAGIGKTTIDSISDILSDLPPIYKAPLVVLSEILGIFRGN